MTTLRIGLTDIELAKLLGQKLYLILLWKKRIARGEFFRPYSCPDFFDRWELGEDDLWKEKGGTPGITNVELAKKLSCSYATIAKWAKRAQKGEKFRPYSFPDFFDHWQLRSDNLWEKKGGGC